MKIAMTLHHHRDPRAGAFSAVAALGDAMTRAGSPTQVFTFDDMPPPIAGGKVGALLFPAWCAARFRDGEFDVIDASSGDAWLLATLRGRRETLIVTHSHGLEHVMHEALMDEVRAGRDRVSWRYPLYTGGYRLFEVKRSFQVADLCVFLNDTDRDFAVRRLGVNPDRATVVTNGCDDVLLDHRPRMAPPDGRLVLVQLGSYIPRKGIGTTASAVTRFLSRHAEARVRFLGTGCDRASVLTDYPGAIQDRIEVVRRYDRESLAQRLDDAHVLLFPSVSEGFPLSLVEGMACGLAPIVSRIPGPDQIVVDGQSGLYIDTGDADGLLGHLEMLAADPDRLQTLRLGARARAETFRWSDIADQRLELYEAARSRPRNGGGQHDGR